MFLWCSSTKTVQAILIRQKKHGHQGAFFFFFFFFFFFSLYIYIENFKNLLVRNHWTDLSITWQECSFCNPLPRLFKSSWFVKKHGCQGAGLIFPICLYRKLKNSSCQKPLDRAEMFPWWLSIKINKIVRNQWTDFNITWQECFFRDSLPGLFTLSWFIKKHGCQGAGLIFSVYLCRKL